MKVRALIVEDESPARGTLRDFAARAGWIEIIGEAADGAKAVKMIDELRPELIFLDVRMPGFSGLRVLEIIRHQPFVVFTTAFDEHAVAAFELGALDYLLKPFGIDRFMKSLTRVRRYFDGGRDASADADLGERAALSLAHASPQLLAKFFVRDARGRAVPIEIENITRLTAADDYVEIHVGGKSYLMNMTLGDFERRLDPARFRRVHRSHIVNLDRVKSFEPYDRRMLLRLSDDTEILSSRAGARILRDLLL